MRCLLPHLDEVRDRRVLAGLSAKIHGCVRLLRVCCATICTTTQAAPLRCESGCGHIDRCESAWQCTRASSADRLIVASKTGPASHPASLRQTHSKARYVAHQSSHADSKQNIGSHAAPYAALGSVQARVCQQDVRQNKTQASLLRSRTRLGVHGD